MSTKLSDATLQEAAKIAAATMHEATGKIGALPSYIKPVAKSMKICGRAFPVKGPSGCNLWLHRAIAKAEPGERDQVAVIVDGLPAEGQEAAVVGIPPQRDRSVIWLLGRHNGNRLNGEKPRGIGD